MPVAHDEILTNTSLLDGLSLEPRHRTRSVLAKGWTVEVKQEADLQSVTLSSAAATDGRPALTIRHQDARDWMRIYQEIDPKSLPFNQSCRVSIQGSASCSTDKIAYVSILSQGTDGKLVFHTRVFENISFSREGSVCERTVTIAPAVEKARYFFVLHFTGDIEGLTLTQCSLVNKALLAPPKAVAPDTALSVGVVAWDMTHNPVGRAYLLADILAAKYRVELLGPSFPQYGTEIWAPIRASTIPCRTFPAGSFREFVAGAMQMVKENRYDVVHVCKPRLPSLLIGLLYKLYWDIPVIVDVDDYELSFFDTEESLGYDELLAALEAEDWSAPYRETWTRFADRMVEIGDSVTVSNPTLMQRFGGYIVRHARDEKVFDPALYDREAVRAEFGLRPEDKVILFLGTPRAHKGIYQIAEALEEIGDPQAVFCIIGTIRDKRVKNAFAAYGEARIVFHDDQPFSRIPELVSMADIVCLPQDPAHPTSQHQIPAKLTDALAMGVPVIASRVPPLHDIIAAQAILGADGETLAAVLRGLLVDETARRRQGEKGRRYYLTEFSYAVNLARAELAVKTALARKQPVQETYFRLLQMLQERLQQPIDRRDFARMARRYYGGGFGGPISLQRPLNVAFFWKQNDSGIYGRRPDMIAKYLAQHEKIGKIMHFDAPIGLKKLHANVQTGEDARFKQGNLIVRNTMERFLKMQDEPDIFRRVFLYDDGGGDSFLGQALPALSEYPEFVAQSLYEAGIYDNVMAWVCPVGFEFPAVQDRLGFPFVAADIIDNHLAWELKPDYAARVRANYDEIVGRADIVFANCDAMRQEMLPRNAHTHVVPNGAELLPAGHGWGEAPQLRHIPRPMIGYVGNLSDRVHLPLLERIAREHPEWSLVLAGSAHLNDEILSLRRYPNVHLLGVLPYEQALGCIARFDVAIIPHEVNAMTEAMNPLKLYVYASTGVPVVSTDLPNIGDLAKHILIAADDDAFLGHIRSVLAGATRRRSAGRTIEEVSWPKRIDAILGRIEDRLAETQATPAPEAALYRPRAFG